jgi:hypothetical protein
MKSLHSNEINVVSIEDVSNVSTYLGITLTDRNEVQDDIKCDINCGYACDCSVQEPSHSV